jgi:predicted RNA methylase
MNAVDPHIAKPTLTSSVLRPRLRVVGEGETGPKVDSDALLGQYIPLHYHGQMLATETRVSAFREAIARLVPTGGVALELGGGTGIMSYFAAKKARKVICVERIPHVAAAARKLLARNGVADRVTVIEDDAATFLPDEPVDAVICEMLHTALLREKQTIIIDRFKQSYLKRFGGPLPIFIPEATILAVQPVGSSYNFQGYEAPVPMFHPAHAAVDPTVQIGAPDVYAMFEYRAAIPQRFEYDRILTVNAAGTLNGLRFITKNLVGIVPEEKRSFDWHMDYLVMPLPEALEVAAGDQIRVQFEYDAGDSVTSLGDSLLATKR